MQALQQSGIDCGSGIRILRRSRPRNTRLLQLRERVVAAVDEIAVRHPGACGSAAIAMTAPPSIAPSLTAVAARTRS